MTRHIVVLSGRIASGKSTLAQGLVEMFDAKLVSTRQLLEARAAREGVDLGSGRSALQQYGTAIDQSSRGAWLAQELAHVVADLANDRVVLVDSVRLAEQLMALRAKFGRTVFHLHLTAFDRSLKERFDSRGRAIDTGSTFEEVSSDLTERQVESLAPIADLQVNTSVTDVRDVMVLCASKIGLLAPIDQKLVDVLVGGAYGSEGKGNLAYYLAPEYDVLVRVGGPNAGHQVPTLPVVTHRSLPSGSIANKRAELYIGAGAVLSPSVLRQEIEQSGVDPLRVHIDPQAMVISRADTRAERKLRAKIGSTGQGVGQATARRILDRTNDQPTLARADKYLKQFVGEPIVELLEKAFAQEKRVFLEGTQGTALSLFHGQYPHVTSRDTTVATCLAEAGIGIGRVRKTVLVIRSYPIRVNGKSGPMGHEIDWAEVSKRSEIPQDDLERAEMSSVQKKLRRVAEFDWKLLRSSAQLNTPTDIALTFADYLSASNSTAYRFEQLDPATREFIEDIESVASAPVSLISGRFTDRSVIDRRRWRGHVSHPPTPPERLAVEDK